MKTGVLAGVPESLPALARAARLGHCAAQVGFDWTDEREVRGKIAEELREIEDAVLRADPRAIEEELGDALLAIVSWSRHLRIDPEAALRGANRKFERRFAAMEELMNERGLAATELSATQWESLWAEVKTAE